ncbi:hypothetical protein GCM10014715_53800 [Streptomyces spiralis]|uniref:Uncharacterized protein n=1 Tax=Streptomyces spiralis TaxID=66376 RepID=A0A919A9M7_9ACTN|nr:hypothetical protein GCM10014715_53800 [Streptomyces spiralis]
MGEAPTGAAAAPDGSGGAGRPAALPASRSPVPAGGAAPDGESPAGGRDPTGAAGSDGSGGLGGWGGPDGPARRGRPGFPIPRLPDPRPFRAPRFSN